MWTILDTHRNIPKVVNRLRIAYISGVSVVLVIENTVKRHLSLVVVVFVWNTE